MEIKREYLLMASVLLISPFANADDKQPIQDGIQLTSPPTPNYPMGAAIDGRSGNCTVYFDALANETLSITKVTCTDQSFCWASWRAFRDLSFISYRNGERDPRAEYFGQKYPITYSLEDKSTPEGHPQTDCVLPGMS